MYHPKMEVIKKHGREEKKGYKKEKNDVAMKSQDRETK